MASEYRTIAGPSEGVYREKMSRFLAFAFPVMSALEAKEVVARVANEYHDARHVCWAYMIGADCKEFLSSDNGEPSGTAGKPILGQIRSAELTNIVIAVVRYFGGIKLGTSGLIVAYREAARLAIEAAEIVVGHEMATISFTFPYQSMNSVMQLIKGSEARVLAQEFDNTCAVTLTIRSDHAATLTGRLRSIPGVSVLSDE